MRCMLCCLQYVLKSSVLLNATSYAAGVCGGVYIRGEWALRPPAAPARGTHAGRPGVWRVQLGQRPSELWARRIAVWHAPPVQQHAASSPALLLSRPAGCGALRCRACGPEQQWPGPERGHGAGIAQRRVAAAAAAHWRAGADQQRQHQPGVLERPPRWRPRACAWAGPLLGAAGRQPAAVRPVRDPARCVLDIRAPARARPLHRVAAGMAALQPQAACACAARGACSGLFKRWGPPRIVFCQQQLRQACRSCHEWRTACLAVPLLRHPPVVVGQAGCGTCTCSAVMLDAVPCRMTGTWCCVTRMARCGTPATPV